jgi:hypothetical protein
MDTKFLTGLRLNNRLLDNKFRKAKFLRILVVTQKCAVIAFGKKKTDQFNGRH